VTTGPYPPRFQRLRRAGFGDRHIETVMGGVDFSEAARKAGRQIAERLWAGGLVIFGGDYGRGKTTMAAYIASYWNHKRGPVMYRTLVGMFGEQMATFGKTSDQPTPLQQAADAGLLIIDDASEQIDDKSGWRLAELGDVLDKRYCARMPTLILHNFDTTQAMRLRLGFRLTERAREDGGIFRAGSWPNLRAKETA
jgi:DNA replication protein DnaC